MTETDQRIADVKLVRACADWIDEVYHGGSRPDSFTTQLYALADRLAALSTQGDGRADTSRLNYLDSRNIHKIFFDDGSELSPRAQHLRAVIDAAMQSTEPPTP